MSTFQPFARYMFDVAEGPRSDKETDPGGLTIWGFSKDRRDDLGLLPSDPRSKYEAALKEHYWDPVASIDCHDVVRWTLIDGQFNHGYRRGTKMMQRGLGVRADGAIGPLTKAAMSKAVPRTYLQAYAERRRGFYARLTSSRLSALIERGLSTDDPLWAEQAGVEHGWQNRLDRLFAAMWDAGLLKRAPTAASVNTATAAGAAAATVATAAAVTADSAGIAPLQEAVTAAVSGVHPMLGAVVPVLGGAISRWWAKRRGKLA